MNAQEVTAVHAEALEAAAAATSREALEELRVKYLSRKGMVQEIMKGLRDLPNEERPVVGQMANKLKVELGDAIKTKTEELEGGGGEVDAFDFSLPGSWRGRGSRHPISMVIERAVGIFHRLGFTVSAGPDIENVHNNFDALNTPADHPSRDPADTFYLEDGSLLRTQTSPVQIRYMMENKPPVRIVSPGRCYRRDTTDATHSANFHQIEGLYVDDNVSMADLKSVLTYFAHEMMGPNVKVRLRPHFFPFTEPSVEADFSCHVCAGKGCRVCKNSGWIEIAGAGMVDPNVFKNVGYDTHSVSGYAFGMGIERIAMILYGIPDIRLLYENDARFLNQF